MVTRRCPIDSDNLKITPGAAGQQDKNFNHITHCDCPKICVFEQPKASAGMYKVTVA
jgi:hypothetical protein